MAAAPQQNEQQTAGNAELRALLEVLPVGVAIVNAVGKPILVNDAVRAIWGQQLLIAEDASQYGEYHAWRAATGEPVAAEDWGLARALSKGETTVGEEYSIETFDGQRKAILDSAAPLRDASGTVIGAVSVIFDITQRRQLEQRARDTLEAFIAITRTLVEAPDETPHTAPKGSGSVGGVLYENPLARRLAELTQSVMGCSRVSITELEGADLLIRPIAIVGLSPEQERQWWAEQELRAGKPVGDGLMPDDLVRLLAGQVLTFDLTRPPYEFPNAYGVTAILAAPMRAQGKLIGLLGLDFEGPANKPHTFTQEEMQIAEAVARLGAVVLERDRLLREREAARAEALALSEANRRMDEFLGIAGHELRTPITTIKANLQLAERRARQALEAIHEMDQKSRASWQGGRIGKTRAPVEPHEQLEQLLHLLERASKSARRQERLVEDLLDISRISAGRLDYRMAPHDLVALARESVEEQRLNDPRRRIDLETPQEALLVIADADRISQVLTNYLTNALKYSPANQPVKVTARSQGNIARVEVRDAGPGLTPEQQQHLFERFHRVEGIEVMTGSGVGLGLGLFISKTIIEQHGGAVGIESTPGEGSVFWFTLPCQTNASSE